MQLGFVACAVGIGIGIGIASLAAAGSQNEPPARFSNVPARGLATEDLKISFLLPTDLDSIEGHMAVSQFDLRLPQDLRRLNQGLLRLAALGENQDAYEVAHPERYLPFAYDVSSGGKRRALRESVALIDQLLAPGVAASGARTLHLLELLHAVQNSFRYPVEKNYQLIPEVFPGLLIKMAAHLTVPGGSGAAAVSDPSASSFWRSPGDVRALDLYAGFRRAALPRYDDKICEYLAPKTGWGAHPGFDVRCGEQELTFKLGDERYGGPFNSRVFDALGYYTTPIDPVPGLQLRYDRRVFKEYNSRKLLTMRARLLFIPLYTRTITDIEDPFDRIDHAVLRDGRRIGAAALKRGLLRDTLVVRERPRPETLDANYDTAFERTIDRLVWQSGNAEPKTDALQAIGAWDYDQLDHAARREVRAIFVLAAWVDQFNLRWENTRLAFWRDGKEWSLVHLMSDVGSGLGLASSLRNSVNSDVDRMLWEVTERVEDDGSVRFSGFATSMENRAFDGVTMDDARWMLRKLGALTERQILSALLATSMSAAEVRLALEKLLSKRRKMIEDFGLLGEFPEIAGRAVNRTLDFDPRNGAELERVSLTTPSGRVVPEVGSWRVRSGKLEKLP